MDEYDNIWKMLNGISPLDEHDRAIILSSFEPIHYPKKHRLVDMEEVSKSYVFINSGLARLFGYKEG